MRIERSNIKTVTSYIIPAFALLLIAWNAVGKFYFFSFFEPTSSLSDIFFHISADIDNFYKALMVEAVCVVLQLTAQLPDYREKKLARPLYTGALLFSVLMSYPAMYTIYTLWFNLSRFPSLFAAAVVFILVIAVDAFAELALLNV